MQLSGVLMAKSNEGFSINCASQTKGLQLA